MSGIFKCCTTEDWLPRHCPYFRMLNLDVLDSCPWQPRRRKILKFDFHASWIQSGQWVTFQSGEGEKFGPHMDHCSRSHLSPPGSTGVVSSSSKDLSYRSYTLFPAALGWSILKDSLTAQTLTRGESGQIPIIITFLTCQEFLGVLIKKLNETGLLLGMGKLNDFSIYVYVYMYWSGP